MGDTTYHQLDRDPGSSKTVFMGHRRWLRDDDPWRNRKDLFDGETEPQRCPRTRHGEEIDELLKNWKDCPLPGKKHKAQSRERTERRAIAEGMQNEVCFLGLAVLEDPPCASQP